MYKVPFRQVRITIVAMTNR